MKNNGLCTIAFGCAFWANFDKIEIFGVGVDLIIDPVVPVVTLDVRVAWWMLRLGVNR